MLLFRFEDLFDRAIECDVGAVSVWVASIPVSRGELRGRPAREAAGRDFPHRDHGEREHREDRRGAEFECQATMYRIFRQTDDLTASVVHPLTMIETDAMGFVEGNPSIGQYGSFPRVLGYYVREKKLLRLEEAVRKMTSYAAKTMGLRRKGMLREGADADIAIFDLDSVSASLDGNKCYPKGIEYVVVNGRVVVDGGAYDGAMAGRVIRRGHAEACHRTNHLRPMIG